MGAPRGLRRLVWSLAVDDLNLEIRDGEFIVLVGADA